jgi:hypothetical protein
MKQLSLREQRAHAVFLYRVSWIQRNCRWTSNPTIFSEALARYKDLKSRYPGVGVVVIGRV